MSRATAAAAALAATLLAGATQAETDTEVAKACAEQWIAAREAARATAEQAKAIGVTPGEYEAYLAGKDEKARSALKRAIGNGRSDASEAMHAMINGWQPIIRALERIESGTPPAPDASAEIEERGQAIAALETVRSALVKATNRLARETCERIDGRERSRSGE